MNGIVEWLKMIIAAVIVSEVAFMLVPSGNLKKTVRFAIGVMLTYLIVSPLNKIF